MIPTPISKPQPHELLVMGWLSLPVEDWIWLAERAQRQGQPLEKYLAQVLHAHVQPGQGEEKCVKDTP